MEAYTHKLVLHIDEEGRYVLLRDGRLVRPVEFEAGQFVPHRLAGRVWPRLSITNIDVDIVTQNVQVWEGAPPAEAARDVKYSIIVFATRFARRLQATLQSVAHQDFDLDRIEVIVAYVPGLDATDDVIDSIHLAFPELRIVRAPFPERNMKSKGFNINECVRLAAGEWVVLLDADILMRPDMFQRVEEVESGAHFIAPDGRKMLTPELTAKVLLGEYDWWNRWDEVLKGEGEFRYREAMGMPIGFWQAVRRSCFDTVQYEELEHFEGADWRFGDAIRESFGPEVRLEGVPVLHLDHGGSQWYGVDRHR
jgi:hypothetical protein